jgi:hypothetical protein
LLLPAPWKTLHHEKKQCFPCWWENREYRHSGKYPANPANLANHGTFQQGDAVKKTKAVLCVSNQLKS